MIPSTSIVNVSNNQILVPATLLNRLKEDLECSVCSELMTEPVFVCQDMHTMDLHCIKNWSAKEKTCPVCRGILLSTFKTNRYVLNQIEIYKEGSRNERTVQSLQERVELSPSQQHPIPSAPPLSPKEMPSEETISRNREEPAPIHPDLEIFAAVHQGDEESVRRCIEMGSSVNAVDSRGNNLIFYAKTRALIELLLRAGAKIDTRAKRIMTFKQHVQFLSPKAVLLNEDIVTAKLLFEAYGWSWVVNGEIGDWENPWHFVLEKASAVMMLLFIAAGANIEEGPELVEFNRKTPCIFGALASNWPEKDEKIEFLLEYYNFKDNYIVNVLTDEPGTLACFALYRGSPRIASLVLQRGANINCPNDRYSPLTYACKENNLERARWLVERGANINGRRRTDNEVKQLSPLCMAVKHNALPVIKFLLTKHPHIDIPSLVEHSNNKDTFKFLVEQMPADHINKQDQFGRTALYWACARANEGAVKVLLDAGANVHLTDGRGMSPLYVGVRYQSSPKMIRILETLLENGALLFPDTRTYTALHAAVLCNKSFSSYKEGQFLLTVIHFLLEQGLDINAPDEHGRTPIFGPCERGDYYFAITQELIIKGANVNATDDEGSSPLLASCKTMQHRLSADKPHVHDFDSEKWDVPHHKLLNDDWVWECSFRTIRLLLESGADIKAANRNGETALKCLQDMEKEADRVGNRQLHELLKKLNEDVRQRYAKCVIC